MKIAAARRALTLVLLLAGCAGPQPVGGTSDADPNEPTNRKLYAVNDTLDRATLKPVARGYNHVVPGPVRGSVHNLLSNLNNPVQLANDMMQGKPRRAGDTLMRLLINTTFGGAGLFDVASGWGWPDHDTDFGVTLALWGVPSGNFLFLPVLGPSNPRDAVGYGVGTLLDPFTWVSFGGSATFGFSRAALSAVDTRGRLLSQTDAIAKTALDPYATYRSLYVQHRDAQITATQADTRSTTPAWFPQQASQVLPEQGSTQAPPTKAAPGDVLTRP